MKIEDGKGAPIRSFADWARLYDTPQSSHQWKEHRSAYSAAEFILNRNGAESLRARIADALGEQVEFEKVVPEYEVRFDKSRGECTTSPSSARPQPAGCQARTVVSVEGRKARRDPIARWLVRRLIKGHRGVAARVFMDR